MAFPLAALGGSGAGAAGAGAAGGAGSVFGGVAAAGGGSGGGGGGGAGGAISSATQTGKGLTALTVGAGLAIFGSKLQAKESKRRARRANALSPDQIIQLQRAQRISAGIEGAFLPFLTGKFSPKEARQRREDAKFLSDIAGEAQKEALAGTLNMLAGSGRLQSGRAFRLQARGQAEIAKVRELTARAVLQQERDRDFAQQAQAAQILQGFVGQGFQIANRPKFIATDTTGQALAGLGGQLFGGGVQAALSK